MVRRFATRSDRRRRLPGPGRAGARVQRLPRRYTTSNACATCHQSNSVPFNAPKVYNDWATDRPRTSTTSATPSPAQLPYGSVCLGCHTANYAPGKVTPVRQCVTPRRHGVDRRSGASSTERDDVSAGPRQGAVLRERHRLLLVPLRRERGRQRLTRRGPATTPTTRRTWPPLADLANADICGACHSRFAYTKTTYPVTADPDRHRGADDADPAADGDRLSDARVGATQHR